MEIDNFPISYIQRVREYYLALGYATPYRWAVNADVPYSPLKKSLSESTIAIVTTAAPFKQGAGDQGPDAPYNGAAKFFSVYTAATEPAPELCISHIAYDRAHSPATDMASWFPLQQLRQIAAHGVVGRVGDQFFGLPTNRSHKTTIEVDCPMLVSQVLQSGADACLLVPNCPVCHQSVSLAAVQLEAAGIATVIMGCAKDIVERVGVPRFLFSDFPLGNGAGKPHDVSSQLDTLMLALQLLGRAPAARTTVQSPQQWSADPSWKEDYCNIDKLSSAELSRRRDEFDREKQRARQSVGR